MTFRGWLRDVTPVGSTSAMTKAVCITANAATFGAIIKRLRMAEGWTIAELARRSGFTKNHLSLIELGKNMPGLSTTPRKLVSGHTILHDHRSDGHVLPGALYQALYGAVRPGSQTSETKQPRSGTRSVARCREARGFMPGKQSSRGAATDR
jgi:hypothetical protein